MSKRNIEQLASDLSSIIVDKLVDPSPTEEREFFQILAQEVKKKRKPNQPEAIGFNSLREEELLNVYSFLGVDDLFKSRLFALSKHLFHKLYESESFWRVILSRLWKGDSYGYDWKYLRTYCFQKYDSFQKQELKKPTISQGNNHMMKTVKVPNSMENPGLVVDILDETCYHLKVVEHYGDPDYNSTCVNWQVNCYCVEKPSCVSFLVKEKSVPLDNEQGFRTSFSLKAKVVLEPGADGSSKEWFDIIGEKSIIILGVQRLIEELKLDENELNVDRESLKLVRDGIIETSVETLLEEKSFLWFCKFIEAIPFPLETAISVYGNDHEDNLITMASAGEEYFKQALEYLAQQQE